MDNSSVLVRGVLGIPLAALVGLISMMALWTVASVVAPPASGFDAKALLILSPAVVLGWGFGGLVVGTPIWLALHALKLRGPIAGFLGGAAAAPLFATFTAGVLGMFETSSSSESAFHIIVVPAIAGGLAGLTLWWVVYRQGRRPTRA